MQENEENKSWYAAKVFFNRTALLAKALDEDSVKNYIPSEVIASLAFFYSTEQYARELQERFYNKLYVYSHTGTRNPFPIADREMEMFIFVTSAGKQGLLFLGEDKPEYHQGDLVRVTDGPFKGTEGHIKRIKKDRRLIVSIGGVAAVATAFIHPDFLEKVETSPTK